MILARSTDLIPDNILMMHASLHICMRVCKLQLLVLRSTFGHNNMTLLAGILLQLAQRLANKLHLLCLQVKHTALFQTTRSVFKRATRVNSWQRCPDQSVANFINRDLSLPILGCSVPSSRSN